MTTLDNLIIFNAIVLKLQSKKCSYLYNLAHYLLKSHLINVEFLVKNNFYLFLYSDTFIRVVKKVSYLKYIM